MVLVWEPDAVDDLHLVLLLVPNPEIIKEPAYQKNPVTNNIHKMHFNIKPELFR